MKKVLSLFTLIMIFMSLTACSNVDLSTTTRITPPKVKIPVEGIWQVERYAFSAIAKVDEKEIAGWIGQRASFSDEKVTLPDDNCEKPEFKIKSVNTKTYLHNNYKSLMEDLGIKQSEIKVITITSNESYFREIIKIDDSTIVIINEGVFFFLSKQQNEIKTDINNIGNGKKLASVKLEPFVKQHESGLLLGFKYYKAVNYKLPYINEKKPILEPVYRTLWISYDGSVQEVSELPFLFVPRRTGFWKLEMQREIANNYGMDLLLAAPIGKETNAEGLKGKNIENTYFHDLKSINFVGNDYVCYERDNEIGTKGNLQSIVSHSLEVVPLDTIYTGTEIPISASKILGEEGIKALNSGAKSYLRTISEEDKSLLKDVPAPTNFGVFRENGKWLLRGRLNYLNLSQKHEYVDFNVPMVAPENLVNYDSLFPSWEVIKQKVPGAVDGYTSPNKDTAVILTNSKLLVYTIKNNVLEELPLKEVELKNSEVSIMAQWALDDYVKVWSEEVKAVKVK
jgi:hypothetical protein